MDRNLLMVAGPTEIEEDVLSAGAKPMVYNRTSEFSKFYLGIIEKLQKVFRTENDVLILSCSGTGAMEAAVTNLLSEGDEVIVVSGGTFGRRWFDIASIFNVKCHLVSLPQGRTVTSELIKPLLSDKIKAVFLTANETSTGVLTDIEPVGDLVKGSNAILVVDAVSSLGADPIETDGWNCDVVISSSQKALALPPGLAFVSVSQKAWRLIDESSIPKFYFDLKEYCKNAERGQTPFTPAISLLNQLDMRLDKMLEIGMERLNFLQRKKSDYLLNGLVGLGLEVIGDAHSSGVLGVIFPIDVDAFDVVSRLRDEFFIEITPSPGEDKPRVARIGIFGKLELSDIDYFLVSLKKILS